MHDNYQILELFPIPVLATIIPQELSNVVPWFYEQEMLHKEVDATNYGERSKNSYILNEPECVNLKSYILNLVKEYGKNLGYVYEEYRFGQSWLSYKHPGQHHIMHTHPNSLISGVFYFGEKLNDTPAIRFHRGGGAGNTPSILPKLVTDKREIKYAHQYFDIEFTPGLLIIFPSYLLHSVPLNKSDKTRCSLAFNSVPTKGFGEEESLTELKF
jgi:uncharacterized protein (TIGR02466 family)